MKIRRGSRQWLEGMRVGGWVKKGVPEVKKSVPEVMKSVPEVKKSVEVCDHRQKLLSCHVCFECDQGRFR